MKNCEKKLHITKLKPKDFVPNYPYFSFFNKYYSSSPTREKSRVTFCDSEATWSHNEFSVIYSEELRQPEGLQPQLA